MERADSLITLFLSVDHEAGAPKFKILVTHRLTLLSSTELAHLYTGSCFLQSIFKLVSDERFIQKINQDQLVIWVSEIINSYSTAHLKRFHYLIPRLQATSFKDFILYNDKLRVIEEIILNNLQNRSPPFLSSFAKEVFGQIVLHYSDEELQEEISLRDGTPFHFSLYRSFDSIDEIFNFKYSEKSHVATPTLERLYINSGASVQTSYSTIAKTLAHMQIVPNGHFIDLGSGFGRVGLMLGLLREDITFSGYEFVKERVDHGNEIAKRFMIEDRIKFFEQDLSLDSFKLPKADCYYLYDPFTDQTYQKLVDQFDRLSKHHTFMIAAKGNAAFWVSKLATKRGWPIPLELDQGNLIIFKTKR